MCARGAYSRRAAAVCAGHGSGVALGPIQGSRYPHVAIGTNMLGVSEGLFHEPSDSVDVAFPLTAVTVGAGRLTIAPVCVYCGIVATFATSVSEVGGHASAACTVCGIWPAPAPPVCHAESGPTKGSLLAHMPSERRGSVGIQPCCSPSWYDHAGEGGCPVTVEFPIFQVQKNQFYDKRVIG